MKIGVCTLSIGQKYKELTKLTLQNKKEYCDKYGYTLITDESMYDSSKPIPWSKILQLQKYLDEYDYLVWMDADMLIMNDMISIESRIFKYPEYHIICGSDYKMINTGFMIIRNSQFSKDFLKMVWEHNYEPDSNGNRYQNWEQGSFIHLYDHNYLGCINKIRITEPIENNSYWYNFKKGHFIIHFAGYRGDEIQYVFRKYYPKKLEDETDDMYHLRMYWMDNLMEKEVAEMNRPYFKINIPKEVNMTNDKNVYKALKSISLQNRHLQPNKRILQINGEYPHEPQDEVVSINKTGEELLNTLHTLPPKSFDIVYLKEDDLRIVNLCFFNLKGNAKNNSFLILMSNHPLTREFWKGYIKDGLIVEVRTEEFEIEDMVGIFHS